MTEKDECALFGGKCTISVGLKVVTLQCIDCFTKCGTYKQYENSKEIEILAGKENKNEALVSCSDI